MDEIEIGEATTQDREWSARLMAASEPWITLRRGHDLLPEEPAAAPWEENPVGEGLWIHLASPARSATAVTVTGTVDLWMPKRDPRRARPTKKSVVSVPFELKGVPLP